MFPQLCPCRNKTGFLKEKSQNISGSPDRRLSELFRSKLSFEGHTSGIKPTNSIENLKEMIRLPGSGAYNRKDLIQEQLELIRHTDTDRHLQRFAAYLAKKDNGLQKLGMLLWQWEQDKDILKEHLIKKDWEAAESRLEESFSFVLEQMEARLDETLKKNIIHNIQSTSLVKSTWLPREIAKGIITEQGHVNTGLLEFTKDALIKRNKNVLSHDVSLTETIMLLLQSRSLRNLITEVNPPLSPQSPAATVIRAALSLHPDEPIRRVHAIRTVATALLSHLRQQEKRSCFAAFLAINMKQSHIKQCIDDFNSLLQYSHLSREDSEGPEHFPFLLKMSNLNLNDEFDLDRDNPDSILCSAGLAAACRIMGLDGPGALPEGIALEIKGPATPKKIIEKLAAAASLRHSDKTAAQLYQEGCFAFGSATFNPLLKVWVNAIAGMAESHANCFFGSCIIKTIMTVLHKVLASKNLSADFLHEFEKLLFNRFSAAIQLIYDPSIGMLDETQEGGFVLYQGHDDGEFRYLKRIDNAAEFSRFIEQTVQSCGKDARFCSLADSLVSVIQSPTFSETILSTYNDLLFQQLDKTEQQTVSTPWINHLGHDASDIMRVYLSRSHELKPIVLTPKKGKALLRSLIATGKKLAKTEQKKLKRSPYLLKPARIRNYHAFSLMIGHPTLQKAWRDRRTSKKWVDEEILSHGAAISSSIITKQQRRFLAGEFGLSRPPAKATIKDFRKYLVKSLHPLTVEEKLKVDKLIVETLPRDLKNKLKRTIVHFADTNLHNGLNDIHFCFIVNPGTGKIEIWQITDDNSKIIPMDQSQLIKDRRWEIYLLT